MIIFETVYTLQESEEIFREIEIDTLNFQMIQSTA